MNKVFLLVMFFLFPSTQISVGFASPCPEVDLVSGANTEIHLAMAVQHAPDERGQSPAKAEKVELSPAKIAILVFIMILIILVGVLRFRMMAIENDLL